MSNLLTNRLDARFWRLQQIIQGIFGSLPGAATCADFSAEAILGKQFRKCRPAFASRLGETSFMPVNSEACLETSKGICLG